MNQRQRLIKLLIVGAAVGISFWRTPSLFTQPRFWAEEGQEFFSQAQTYAHTALWYRGLTGIHIGYFSIWPNIATTFAANLVPLEHAPAVTTLLALTVQLVPVAIILWGRSVLWRTYPQKLACILIVVFAPLSSEIWLTTTNSQFHFGLITFLILVAETGRTSVGRWLYRVPLVLAGLTGPLSCFLSPLFALKAVAKKETERIVQAVILLICAVIQLTILWLSMGSEPTLAKRLGAIDLPLLSSIVWTQSIGLVLFGLTAAKWLAGVITTARATGGFESSAIGLGLMVLEATVLTYVSAGRTVRERVELVGSYLILIVPSTLASLEVDKARLLNPGNAARYFWVPNVIFLLMVADGVQRARDAAKVVRLTVLGVFLVGALAFGLAEYREALLVSDDWPKWRDEVRLWREQPARVVQVWPPGWGLRMTDLAGNEPPFGFIDGPSDGAVVGRSVVVSGWALDDSEIWAIRLYVDGRLTADARLSVPRPDVAKAARQYARGTDIHGWMVPIDLGPEPGPRTVRVEAVDDRGTVQVIGVIRLVVHEQ